MTITVDTDLTEILTSKEIQEDLDEWNKTIQTLIEKRQSAIANVTTADGGIGPEQLVEGEAIFYDTAIPIGDECSLLSEDIKTGIEAMGTAAYEQEYKELKELRNLLEAKIEALDESIRQKKAEEKEATKNIALTSGSQYSMISPQANYEQQLQQLDISRTGYVDKLTEVYNRIKTLDSTFVVPSISGNPLDELPNSSGSEESSTEDVDAVSGAAPEAESETEQTPSYTIPLDDEATLEDMYNSALNLNAELYEEEEYLKEVADDLIYSQSVLYTYYQEGIIDSDVYEQLNAEYQAKINAIEQARLQRVELLYGDKGLENAVEDNFAWNDGWLKDFTESGIAGSLKKDGSNYEALRGKAVERLGEMNQKLEHLQPLSEIVSEYDLSGVSPVVVGSVYSFEHPELNKNPYMTQLANAQNSKYTMSETSYKAAYEYAKKNNGVTEIEVNGGTAYVYSSKDYFEGAPPSNSWNNRHIIPESEYAIHYNDYHGDACSNGDTVYYDGQYYTWLEFSNKYYPQN